MRASSRHSVRAVLVPASRAANLERPRVTGEPTRRLGLIGRDIARVRTGLHPRRVIAPLAALLLVALGVAALRIELLRVRYALGEATMTEQRLADEERSLTARRRELRDPVALARRAEALGFRRPVELIDVPVRRAVDDDRALAAAARGPEPR